MHPFGSDTQIFGFGKGSSNRRGYESSLLLGVNKNPRGSFISLQLTHNRRESVHLLCGQQMGFLSRSQVEKVKFEEYFEGPD